jgi:hypothetical protein
MFVAWTGSTESRPERSGGLYNFRQNGFVWQKALFTEAFLGPPRTGRPGRIVEERRLDFEPFVFLLAIIGD